MFDEEIEKAVLYYIILEEKDLDINEDDFFNAKNKRIAKAIIDLKKTKDSISILTVGHKINAPNKSDVINYLSGLGENVLGTDCDIAFNTLKQLSKKRKIFDLGNKIQNEIEKTENLDDYIANQIKKLNEINNENIEDEYSFDKQVSESALLLEQQMSNKLDNSLKTGLRDIDVLTDGLHQEELTIIGARPRCW